jgi:hypothetical protein
MHRECICATVRIYGHVLDSPEPSWCLFIDYIGGRHDLYMLDNGHNYVSPAPAVLNQAGAYTGGGQEP